MPPQQTPAGQNPNLDFIMNSGSSPKKGLNLPGLNMPRPVKYILAVIGILAAIIIFAAIVFGGKGGNYQSYIDAMARGQEISRVSSLITNDSPDQTTQNLAATVQTVLTSQQAQLTTYLKTNHVKPSTKQLAVDKNSATDSQLQTAAQNNNLDVVYDSYLKQNLALYQTDLSTAFNKSGPKGKVLLNDCYNGIKVLLASPPLGS